MKRLLPLIVLSLLLLAPAAEAGEVETLEKGIREADVKIEYLRQQLDETKDPQKQDALRTQLAETRSLREHFRVELGAVRQELGELRARAEELRVETEQDLEQATEIANHEQELLEAMSKADAAAAMNDAESDVQVATRNMGRAHEAHAAVQRALQQIAVGELAAARDAVMEAEARHDECRQRRKSWRGRRQARAARKAAADTQRVEKEAARIAEVAKAARNALLRTDAGRAGLERALAEASQARRREEAKRLRDRMAEALLERKRILAAQAWLEKARLQLDTKRFKDAKVAVEKAKKELEEATPITIHFKDGEVTVVHRVTLTVGPEQIKARERIRELEVKLEELRARGQTDPHPEVRELTAALEQARAHLAELDQASKQPGFVTGEDGEYVIRGLVHGKHTVATVQPRVLRKGTEARRGWIRIDEGAQQEMRERIEHLRQAAHHLHEAGQHEQGRKLELEAQELEERLHQARFVVVGGAGSPQVMEAIDGLRREVRELRREVRELKELLQRDR